MAYKYLRHTAKEQITGERRSHHSLPTRESFLPDDRYFFREAHGRLLLREHRAATKNIRSARFQIFGTILPAKKIANLLETTANLRKNFTYLKTVLLTCYTGCHEINQNCVN